MDKLLTKAEVIEITGFSYPQIWRWMREGKFPRSLKVGKGPAGRVMWKQSEIEKWIDSLPTQTLKGDGAKSSAPDNLVKSQKRKKRRVCK